MSIIKEENGKYSSRRFGAILSFISGITFSFLFTWMEKPFDIWLPIVMFLLALILWGLTSVSKILEFITTIKNGKNDPPTHQ